MSHQRILQVSALALGLFASNVIVLADAASAQDRPSHERGNRNGGTKPTTTPRVVTPTPAPRIATPAPRVAQPQVARPAPSHWYNRAPSHVSPPPAVRHAAPAPQYRREHEPRRGWGWRPWAYGAAAAGAVIVGSRYANASRSSVQVCADRYESFDWETGTIENEYGERELCPYLE
jgi:hypothetical protein